MKIFDFEMKMQDKHGECGLIFKNKDGLFYTTILKFVCEESKKRSSISELEKKGNRIFYKTLEEIKNKPLNGKWFLIENNSTDMAKAIITKIQ
jgi:hypothetical protein